VLQPTADQSEAPCPGPCNERLLRRYAASGDPHDLEALVLRYRPMACRLARRYTRDRGTLEDLEQVACLGLVKAIKRFDPERGFAFSTYAVPTIVGEVKRWFRETSWCAHVPRPMQEQARAVRSAAEALQRERGTAPTAREIAEALDWPDDDVVDALCAAEAMTTVPLEGDDEHADARVHRLGVVDPGFEFVECRAAIEGGLAKLNENEKEVLRLRFAEELSHREIGLRLGVPAGEAARTLRHAMTCLADVATAGKADELHGLAA